MLDGRYRLEELIGEGGMGSVWRASDEALGRTVAVKVFWAGATEDADAVRRESEKRLLASVSHPSLVTLFDAQLSRDDRSYLVMEYVDGGTLASLIARGPVAPPDAASARRRPRRSAARRASRRASSTATSSRRTSCCGRR